MDKEKVWKNILNIVKDSVTSSNFRGWFSQAKIASVDEDKLILVVPSAFIKDQLNNRFGDLIKDCTKQVLGKVVVIEFKIDSTKFFKKELSEDLEESFFQFPQSSPISAPATNLNSQYTLENFVVGLTNNLAFAAAQAVVANPGVSYSPLFIYGPSGVGKTHLMQAIGNALRAKNAYLKVLFVPSERFMNDFVESIQTKRMGDFRSRYRNCDLFLIDDIQFISGKDSMQEEFFHTFNELHAKNLQIVLTSDKAPHEISKLEPRLLSRFQGGLMVDIQMPDFDTRMAILKAKMKERGGDLPTEVLELIAQTVESNTRELEGKLIQILQMKQLPGQKLDLETVKKHLGQPQKPSQKLDQKKVLSEINNYFNIKMTDLVGPRRQKGLVLPRQIAMYILYTDCGLPFEKVGEVLGGRDHTTIMHGVDKIKEASSRDREVQRLLLEIKQQLG